ncbi:hypothetical protein FB45DRAFT_1051151 [Roridomyces roridus]|uniref:Uncharacterized protein n=1 Tax=Roridomyces roridus TaxID=1738132 RepID=A0AAD7CL97_9AGAR|nr:hypothetical protein FB45DRAFT_1051151 [Roridomyces roridus]
MIRTLNEARSGPPPRIASPESDRAPREMHRCLLIPEIVQQIVSNLDIDVGWNHTASGQLASLARTRIFHDDALDALWKHQSTMRHLIKCMPAALWQSGYATDTRRRTFTITFIRPIETSDWDRFLYYSKRVRAFTPPYLWAEDLSQVYDTLLQSDIPGGHLLPNLRRLNCGSSSATPMPSTHLGIGSDVQNRVEESRPFDKSLWYQIR